jgi:glycosyltransferase involved in cell wall biosynthesis
MMSPHGVPATLIELPPRQCLRLLMVSSDTYPPTRVDLTALFGTELTSRGYQTDLILQSEAACRHSYVTEWAGGRVWVGATDLGDSLLSRLRKHLLGIYEDAKLFLRLRTGGHQVIVIKDKFVSGIIGMLAARVLKRRFIYWLSYPFPESYLERSRDGTARYPLLYWIRGASFKVLLYQLLLPLADHIFVQSEQMCRDIEAHGIARERMTAVPMGIQPQLFVVGGAEGHRLTAADRPCILYLGTLAKIRRLDFLLRVLTKVRAVVPTAKLFFVGRGDEIADEQFLLHEARALGVQDAVVFTGQLPRAVALQYVAEAAVCVSPFRPNPVLNSTSPTKLVEYMAMGKAVVANDHPEQRSLIEQSGGGFSVPYQEEAFAEAVVRLIRDPQLADEMGRRGQQYVFESRSYAVISQIVDRELQRLERASNRIEDDIR